MKSSYTKEQAAAHHAQWWKNLPEEQKDLINFRSKLCRYGVTVEDYAQLLNEQNGVCAICGKPETHQTNGLVWALSIDHDHVTKKVRGLLCVQCNHILGKAKDNPAILRNAADYLDKHASV